MPVLVGEAVLALSLGPNINHHLVIRRMASAKPLAYEGVSSDIEKLNARNVDLSGLLPPLERPAPEQGEDSLGQSYDFVRVARAALRTAATGEVDEAVNNISIPFEQSDGCSWFRAPVSSSCETRWMVLLLT